MASRRSHLLQTLVLVAALVGAILLIVPGSPIHKPIHQGLDLKGGLETVLQAEPPATSVIKLTPEDMSRSVTIMRERCNKLGVSGCTVRQQGNNQIIIQLPAIHDRTKAAGIIGKTAELELYDLTPSLYTGSIGAQQNPIPHTSLYSLLTGVQSQLNGKPSAYYLFDKKTKKPVKQHGGPEETRRALLQPYHGKLPDGTVVLAVPGRTVVITCSGEIATVCPGVTDGQGNYLSPLPVNQKFYYLFKHGHYLHDTSSPYPQMEGKYLKLSGTQADVDQSGAAVVTMHFTKTGNDLFHQITRDEARRGSALGVSQSFAIVLDDDLYSFPSIDPSQNPDGIDPTGTGAEITGVTTGEAKSLALVLQTGALPVKFTTVEQTDISATLGKDSLKQARDAAIGGLLVVALFLLILYRFLGLVAVIGLAIYAAFMYAAIVLFGVTLTLPGFAGLILTIGVAADSNVVIFERIKEEVRSGKSVRAAIAAGYAKGFRTIVDANVVTAITAIVLFGFATDEVKGFALMLLIGTVVSLITAVAATRALLGLLAGFKWFENPKFMGAAGVQRGRFLQLDFMRRRHTWFAISGVIVVVSLAALGLRGLNLGIDFKGGVQITFKTAAPTSLTVVRATVPHDAVVQGRGESSGDDYKSFQIQMKKLTPTEQDKLLQSLNVKVKAVAPNTKNVSSSFGHQIAIAALWSIFGSLLLIVLYIAIRFDFKYSVPVIVALVHDIVITIGVYALTGREVTTSTVAAILTVLGYSIYDTIIIFDRIRENTPLMKRAPYATIANISLWETIRRSLATTFITLLPVVALLFFGGSTLKDFAFALIIGITAGAYSSIFIAAPLLTILKEREPEYKRRRAENLDGARGDAVLAEAEAAAAAEPNPETPIEAIEHGVEAVVHPDGHGNGADTEAKRAARRQRRKHGRPR